MRDGTIVAVGSEAEVRASAGADAELLDLRPAVLTPGLTDSHIHLLEWAFARRRPDLTGAGSVDEVLARVAEAAGSVGPDDWLECRGWDPDACRGARLEDLDGVTGSRAVALIAHDLHSGWLNSEALRRAGVTADRGDPPGGSVERDETGRPTGVLREVALDWWYRARPRPGASERRAALLDAQRSLHRFGVTGVHSVEGAVSLRDVQDLERRGELRLRVLQHIRRSELDAALDCGLTSGFGSEWLRIGGVKIFADGALGSRTAWMLEPYLDTGDRGIRRVEPDELAEDVQRAARGGIAATVHAIGDAAVRMTLDCLERASLDESRIPHRIEHLQCVRPEDLERPGRAGIVASMQPSHLLTDIPHIDRAWGDSRAAGTFAFRRLLQAGTTLAFGSDAPVESADPREGFWAAMARRDRSGQPPGGWHPDQRLTGREVLEAYTVGPARAAGVSGRVGRLAPGYAADFVAWDLDPTTAEPEELKSAAVRATVVGGEPLYRA